MPWSNTRMITHVSRAGDRQPPGAMTSRIAPLLAIALSMVVLGQVAAGADEGDAIVIADSLEPAYIEVEPGASVTWRNSDTDRHRVRSTDGPEAFDSGNLEPGETFTFTFRLEGSYPYVDHRDDEDPAYFGSVVVATGGSKGDRPLPKAGEVSIIDRAFRPPSLEIATGGSVTWSNDDGETHTVTSTTGTFDSDILGSGGTFTQPFPEAGTFSYLCEIHPEMRGTVVVSHPVGASPIPAATQAVPASAAPSAVAAAVTVSVIDRSFQPADVEVAVGETVAWSNDDTEGDTVTAIDGAFNSGVMTAGAEFPTTFDAVGTFDYFCAIHPEMTGSVTVTEPVPDQGG